MTSLQELISMSEESFPCPNCEIGQCHPSKHTFLGVYNGMFVSAPQIPFWTCDICQYQEFDREAIEKLETLIGFVDAPQQRPPEKVSTNDTRKRSNPGE
jgi:hypothetical protein